MRLVVLGDSHAWALKAGLENWRRERPDGCPHDVRIEMFVDGDMAATPFFERGEDRITFADVKTRNALRAALGRPYVSADDRGTVFALQLAQSTTRLVRSETWRHFRPWRVAPDNDQQPVSDAVIRAMALERNRFVLDFFRELLALNIRCVAIGAPPLDAGEAAHGYAGPATMLEVDRLARDAVSEILRTIGVPIVLSPAEAYAGQPGHSFLRSDMSFQDALHANERFGRVMVELVVAAASTQRPWMLVTPLLA
jgi:hypothetical protein